MLGNLGTIDLMESNEMDGISGNAGKKLMAPLRNDSIRSVIGFRIVSQTLSIVPKMIWPEMGNEMN